MQIKINTPNNSNINKLEIITEIIQSLEQLINKIETNTITDDELYKEIIKLYQIGTGPHGKTEILLNSQKYNFQFLKTNITIAKQLIIKNKNTNETIKKIFYYPCIIKVATLNSYNPDKYFKIEEIIYLIKKREIVLWEIVWPTTNFDPNNKYTKDIKEGYSDLEMYKCIYPNNDFIIKNKELLKILDQYIIQDRKMKNFKTTNLEQYKSILSFIKSYFTKEQLESDKRKLERQYQISQNSNTKKKVLSRKE